MDSLSTGDYFLKLGIVCKPETEFSFGSLPEHRWTLAMLPVRTFKNCLGRVMAFSINENEVLVKGIMLCDFSDSVRPG